MNPTNIEDHVSVQRNERRTSTRRPCPPAGNPRASALLTQLRAMFHRVEHRLAQDNALVAQVISALAQKLDAIDIEVIRRTSRARSR